MRPPEELLEAALRAVSRDPARGVLAQHRGEAEEALAALERDLRKLKKDPAAAEQARNVAEHAAAGLDRIERTLLHGNEAQTEAARKQVARLCTALAPGRKAQERVYSIFSFLFEHGGGLIPRLLGELDVTSFKMNEVEL